MELQESRSIYCYNIWWNWSGTYSGDYIKNKNIYTIHIVDLFLFLDFKWNLENVCIWFKNHVFYYYYYYKVCEYFFVWKYSNNRQKIKNKIIMNKLAIEKRISIVNIYFFWPGKFSNIGAKNSKRKTRYKNNCLYNTLTIVCILVIQKNKVLLSFS